MVTMTFVPTRAKSPPAPVQPPDAPLPPIFTMPDEILIKIITLATSRSAKSDENKASLRTSAALARVSRRFHRIATPILYADLHIGTWHAPSTRFLALSQTRLLHRTLAKNPALRAYIRVLGVYLPRGSRFERHRVPILRDLLGWLSGAREVRFTGSLNCDTKAWIMVRELLPGVREAAELSVGYEIGRECLWRVCPMLEGMPALKRLTLSGLRIMERTRRVFVPWTDSNDGEDSGEENTDGSEDSDSVDWQGEMVKVPVEDEEDWAKLNEGAGGITALTIRGFEGTPEEYVEFLRWPAKLEHITMGNATTEQDDIWTLPTLLAVLEPQCRSLRTITIDVPARAEYTPDGIDLSRFESLEELTLLNWPGNPPGLHGQQAGMLAPRLRRFTWHWPRRRKFRLAWLAPPEPLLDDTIPIIEDRVKWLREFGRAAAGRPWGSGPVAGIGMCVRTPLREIRVVYRDKDLKCRDGALMPGFLRGLFEKAAGDLAREGIVLTCDGGDG